MDVLLEAFRYDYAIRALIASAFVGLTCGLLGCFVVLRRMAMIGDALSHAILPGVVAGFLLFGHNPLAIFAGAVSAGLLTTLVITWIQRNSITKDDASVGIVFTGMFALGIIGISWLTKKEGVHLDMKDFLFGNVLGVSDADLWLTGLIGLYVFISIVLFYKYLFITTFDPLIAMTMGISVAAVHYFFMFLLSLTIVSSLQSVGVILVVAMLIIPASTAYLLTYKLRLMLFLAALIGLLSAASGLALAILYETTPGPAMTLVSVSIFGIALLFSPKRGVLVQLIRSIRRQYIAEQQDFLKLIDKLLQDGPLTTHKLHHAWAHSRLLSLVHLYHLQHHKHLKINKTGITLTDSGKHEADLLVRAHRLWESYLVKEMNIPSEHIHESAEKFEHVLPTEFIDKVDKQLGFPATDPHGSPIPKIRKRIARLSDVGEGQVAVIHDEQGDYAQKLWQLGIMPKTEFIMRGTNEQYVLLEIKNRIFEVTRSDAEGIKIRL